jgi:DNA modification methylase
MNPETLRKIRAIVQKQMRQEQPPQPPVAPVEPTPPQEPVPVQEQPAEATTAQPEAQEAAPEVATQPVEPVEAASVRNQLIFGDCLEFLRTLPDSCVSSCLTDPPYALDNRQPDIRKVLSAWLAGESISANSKDFMGKDWQLPGPEIWREVFRVLKPGGHIFSFSATRTYDLMTMALRIAGLEIRDKLSYFCEISDNSTCLTYGQGFPKSLNISKVLEQSGHPEEAELFKGYGSALKPAVEPLVCCSKSEANTEAPSLAIPPFKYEPKVSTRERNYGCKDLFWRHDGSEYQPIEQAEYDALKADNEARKAEEGFEPAKIAEGNIWPCVKSINFMRYLVKMVKMPKDNLILDPFCGSGTTAIACILENCDFIAIEKDPVAHRIAAARIEYFQRRERAEARCGGVGY